MNHAVYADDIVLLAETEIEAINMIHDVHTAITKAGYKWKADSLEVMGCGEYEDTNINLTVGLPPHQMDFKQVTEFKLLGNLITPNAHTPTAMYHRLDITEKTFWRHFRKLRTRGCL